MFNKLVILLFATVASLAPVRSGAQSGLVTGMLDGETIGFQNMSGVNGVPGFIVEPYESGDVFGANVQVYMLDQIDVSIEGAIIWLNFETDGGEPPVEMTTPEVVDSMVMIVDEWIAGADYPARVWLAMTEQAENVGFNLQNQKPDHYALMGQLPAAEFCLHNLGADDLTPILSGGEMVCVPGALVFRVTGAGSASKLDDSPRELEAEVLGRISGSIGGQDYEWLTIFSRGAPTASLQRFGAGQMIRIQGHSPASDDFLRKDVLSLNMSDDFAQGYIPEGARVPVEVSFFPEGLSGVHYSGQDGTADVTAIIISHDLNAEQSGSIEMLISGTMCRVEGFEFTDDCPKIEAHVKTELLREPDYEF